MSVETAILTERHNLLPSHLSGVIGLKHDPDLNLSPSVFVRGSTESLYHSRNQTVSVSVASTPTAKKTSRKPKALVQDVLSLDFETANQDRDPCSIGLYRVVEDEVVLAEEIMIDPESFFDPNNVRLHGIEPSRVQGAPPFPELQTRLSSLITPSTVVLAHNASFDVGVLRKSCERYGLTYPEFKYLCTLKLSQAWFDTLPSCSLNVVADHLGHTFEHHNALADAQAAFEIYKHVLENLREAKKTLPAYMRDRQMTWGKMSAYGYKPFSSSHKAYTLPILNDPNLTTVLTGKRFRLAGDLSYFTKKQAEALLVDCGATISPRLSKNIDYFVYGKPGFFSNEDEFYANVAKAEAMSVATTGRLQVLSNEDFNVLLRGVISARV